MTKPVRVWAAVEDGVPIYHLVAALRETVEQELDLHFPNWRADGYYTIRRATLTLDPVEPKRRPA